MANPQTTVTKSALTVGRILHAYSNRWTGPRPAVVVNAFDRDNMANVNVLFDGANDSECLAATRQSQQGNTFTSVSVIEAGTPEKRALALDAAAERQWMGYGRGKTIKIICEWPR